MTTERSRPRIRSFLDLSTNSLPQEVFNDLASLDGVVAYQPPTAPSSGSPTTRRTRTTSPTTPRPAKSSQSSCTPAASAVTTCCSTATPKPKQST